MRDEALHVCLVGAAASKCDRCHFDGHWRDMVTVSSESDILLFRPVLSRLASRRPVRSLK
jgi:hypothetical protein